MIISLYENNFPVRFGIVLYSSKYITQLEDRSTKEEGDKFEDDISNMIIRLFSYIKGNYGIEMAFKFLSNVWNCFQYKLSSFTVFLLPCCTAAFI
ncbi:UDP-glucose:glycoprotein glucosyltransferase-like [Trifolium medium]|uniref:UDP-glucose:glycoprotein glucosyltransferase-like n=1 Tax=Trifolium medium TaxID=97028 RepID=A0A392R2L0_9FABA|nr:UDP-glucose:glycoprotein glucosyltransferase-like [Trifolium medium]